MIIFERNKEEESRCVACKRDNSHFLCYVILLDILIIIGGNDEERTRCVMCKRDNSHFIMKLSPMKPKSCADHISHTVLDNLIIFGRDEEEDQ